MSVFAGRGEGELHLIGCSFSSFLESDGQPLIDLSLYVSSENYHSATAPAYASLLQWPNQWIIPPQMRSLARKRTEHLGLSSLDLDVMEEEAKQQRSRDDGTAAGQIPVSLARPPRETVSGLLGKTSQQNRIRLDGMTGAFVAPLEELLGGKGHLLSDEIPSSLDCVALGYLSLALVPDLPYPWLSQAVRAHTPRLVSYVNRLWEKCFGSAVDVKTVFLDAAEGASGLPWEAPERISVGRMGKRVLEGLADATPVLREIRASQRLQQAGKDMDVGADLDRELVEKLAQARRREAYAATATVAAGLGLFAGYLVQAGIVTFGLQPDETEADGAGEEAGDAAPLET